MEDGIYLLQQSSLLGSAKATHELAWIYLTHDAYRDEQKAVQLLEKNVNCIDSLHVLSLFYISKKQMHKAKGILRQLCKLHHFHSMLLLGMILVTDEDTAPEGFSLIRKSAELGNNTEALRQTAILLSQGRGTDRDDATALEFFEKAGARGDAISHFMIAHLLMHGRGGLCEDPQLDALQHLKQALSFGLDDEMMEDAQGMVETLSVRVRGETLIGSM